MDIPDSKIKFVCGLSNGETLVENKGVLLRVDGEKSPWWKLQSYIQDNNLTITSFYLSYGDRHFILPSVNPKFEGETPLGYNCFRRFKGDALVGSDNFEHHICAEAIYPDYTLQLWVDENDPNKSWVTIKGVVDGINR